MRNSMRSQNKAPSFPTASNKKNHTPIRPRWMHFPKATVEGKGKEMVILSKDSPLSNIPAEIQLDIIYHLGYYDVLRLKSTCRYFHYFLSSDIIAECRQNQIDIFVEGEKHNLYFDKLPCYECLKIKSTEQFWNKVTQQYYNTHSQTTYGNVTDRHCITCSFKNGEYEPGTRLNVSGQSWVLCAACGVLKNTISGATKTCHPCQRAFDFRQTWGYVLRFCQWFLAVVTFALSCTGSAMPTTSVANRNSLRFIFTAFVCLLTIGGTLNSFLLRGGVKTYHGYRTRRSENNKFVFRVELCAALAWIGVLASVINEGHRNDFKGKFDKFAKAMLGMIVLECSLFVLSSWWGYRTSWQRRQVARNVGMYLEVNT